MNWKIETTGASYTTTFTVKFSLAFYKDEWKVCPCIAEISKGYRNGRVKYILVPNDCTVVSVTLNGSANPRGFGYTPEEFAESPLEKAHIIYNGVYPPPKKEDLEKLITEGVKELANRLPGRFCPYPPLKDKWLPIPSFTGREAIEIAKQIGEYRSSWIYGKIHLNGKIKGGLRQRGFFATTNPQIWRLCWLISDTEYPLPFYSELLSKERWSFEEAIHYNERYLSRDEAEFRMGHHLVRFSNGIDVIAAKSLKARGTDGEEHEWVEVLIHTSETELEVKADGDTVKTVVEGHILLVHHPHLVGGID